jgi:uncharacterized membrane protein YoaK (UPF0700 family)
MLTILAGFNCSAEDLAQKSMVNSAVLTISIVLIALGILAAYLRVKKYRSNPAKQSLFLILLFLAGASIGIGTWFILTVTALFVELAPLCSSK